jgi:hypothetical protein
MKIDFEHHFEDNADDHLTAKIGRIAVDRPREHCCRSMARPTQLKPALHSALASHQSMARLWE